MKARKLTIPEAISLVAHEVCLLRGQKEKEFEWFKSHAGLATRQDLDRMEDRIMKSVSELTADVKKLTAESKKTQDTITKVGVETGKTLEQVTALNAKIVELQEQVANGASTAELETAINELATQSGATLAQAQATDDQVPDPITPPVEPPAEPA